MSIKNWILHGVNRINHVAARPDLPRRGHDHELEREHEPEYEYEETLPGIADPPLSAGGERASRIGAGREPGLASATSLGAYAPLIDAIRDELEHFVASHVRLHLAIADRDRFVLISIGIGCDAAEAPRRLLQQFVHEFKPEQVKRYLAREVIGGLPNAAAIDLSQFAGLFDADAEDKAKEDAEAGEYRELLEALRSTPAPAPRPYRVSVVGRWVELDAPRTVQPAASPPRSASPSRAAPATPLSGERCEFDVEDGSGRRRVVLQGVVPGRRYVVGNGEGCDVRVEGTFSSRRHAELWLENGSWWVADAGSTNGIRLEPTGLLQRKGTAPAAVGVAPTRLVQGLRIVLSARAEGPASDYPWLALRPPASPPTMVTPIATANSTRTAILASRAAAALTTPTTQVLAPRHEPGALRLMLKHAAGERSIVLAAATLPVSIGRSRRQTLVVDRAHEGVSGHHLDIVELDADGATLVVHGDNGIVVDGVAHPCGTRLRWRTGQRLELGDAPEVDGRCVLELEPGASGA